MYKTFFVVMYCFLASQHALAHDVSADYYVHGGMSFNGMDLVGVEQSTTTVIDTTYSGSGIRFGGSLLALPQLRLGVSYSQATLGSQDTRKKNDISQLTLTVINMYFDFVFSSGVYLGIGPSQISITYSGPRDLPDFHTFKNTFHLGFLLSLDNNIVIDIAYENYVLDNNIGETTISYQTGSSYVFSIGHLF